MFTGIIREVGTVKNRKDTKNAAIFVINCSPSLLEEKKNGESIAINGVCVTITSKESDKFQFEAISETLERSNLKHLAEGDRVNLEPALKLNQSLDGHLVQGHVDGEGQIESFSNNRLTIKFPRNIAKYLAFKGSIAINGVSLTISDLQDETFSVDLIPHTLKNTNLQDLKKNDSVNLEIDMIARYLEQMLNEKDKEAKYEFLKDRNLI